VGYGKYGEAYDRPIAMAWHDDVLGSALKRLWSIEGRMKWPARILGLGVGALAILGICAASINNIRSCARDTNRARETASTFQPAASSTHTPMASVEDSSASPPQASASAGAAVIDDAPVCPPGQVCLYHINAVGSDGRPMVLGSNVSVIESKVTAPSGLIQNGVHNYNSYVESNGPLIQNGTENVGGIVTQTTAPTAVTADGSKGQRKAP
jgi:hypothetical protein